jgi:hypothetical protein
MNIRRLRLRREVLTELTNDDLRDVVGGSADTLEELKRLTADLTTQVTRATRGGACGSCGETCTGTSTTHPA